MFSFIIIVLIILVIVYIFYREYINKKDKSKPTKLEILQTSNILSDLVFIKDLIIKNLYDAGTLDYINDKHELTRKDFYHFYMLDLCGRDHNKFNKLHSHVTNISEDFYATLVEKSTLLTNEEKDLVSKKIIANNINTDLIFVVYLELFHDKDLAVKYFYINILDHYKQFSDV